MDFSEVLKSTAFAEISLGNIFMFAIGFILLYLAIKKKYEPYLLLPIGFGTILANMPLGDIITDTGLIRIFYYGIQYEVIPPLVFLCVGAMTDFGPMIANPKTLLLGAGAQFGVYIAFFLSHAFGFSLAEACSIGIIGGADGPTTIFLTNAKAPHILGATAVSAYSYMALVPVIIPPVIKLLTSKEERMIVMKQLRPVSKLEKIVFPLVATMLICLLIPKATPLVGMLMFGNLLREAGVVDRLAKGAQEELMNIVTLLLGLAICFKLRAEDFLQVKVILIFGLGLLSFIFSVAGGIMLAKLMNLFLKEKINPMIGAAGLSAVPMSARVVQIEGQKANPRNFLLMHAMGPNVAGTIGTAIAAGLFLITV